MGKINGLCGMPMVTMKKLVALRLLAKGVLRFVKRLSSLCVIHSGMRRLRRSCRDLRCDSVLNVPAMSMLSKRARRLYIGGHEGPNNDPPACMLILGLCAAMPLSPQRGGGFSRYALHAERGSVGVSLLDYYLGAFSETPIPTEPSVCCATLRDLGVFTDEAGEAHIHTEIIKRLSVLTMTYQHVTKRG